MTDLEQYRLQIIDECIKYLQDRPGRNAVRSLTAMRDNTIPPAKIDKPTKNHPWRKYPNSDK